MLALLLALASAAAQAQGPAALEQCHAIAEPGARLACYDRLSGRPAAAPGPDPVEAIVSMPEPPASGVSPDGDPGSILDAAWHLGAYSDRYPISMYHPNYLLPLSYTNEVNNYPYSPVFEGAGIPDQDFDAAEAKFQLSLKARFWTSANRRWGLWLAYTQQSLWQMYNADISRPFRETNYMPEVFVSYHPGLHFAGFDWKILNFGYNHQSNGRADPVSRSWDRLFAEAGLERGNLALMLRAWARIEESDDEDDNPDITDYYGYTELNALYRRGGHSFSFMARGNFDTGKGAVQAGWFSPPALGPLRAYIQVFSGYGESMIDYNWNQTTVGIGLALNDGL
jgi:phospholipase A1